MNAGESKTYQCPGCNREFEITLEPSCVDNPNKAQGYPHPGEAAHCPFCGEQGLLGED
jgi:hypothetical protein